MDVLHVQWYLQDLNFSGYSVNSKKQSQSLLMLEPLAATCATSLCLWPDFRSVFPPLGFIPSCCFPNLLYRLLLSFAKEHRYWETGSEEQKHFFPPSLPCVISQAVVPTPIGDSGSSLTSAGFLIFWGSWWHQPVP